MVDTRGDTRYGNKCGMENMGSRVDCSPYKIICTSLMDSRSGTRLKPNKPSSEHTDFGKPRMVEEPYFRVNVGCIIHN